MIGWPSGPSTKPDQTGYPHLMTAIQSDREILRGLGRQMAEAVSGQDAAGRAEMWRRNNDRDPVRKMVWFTEFPGTNCSRLRENWSASVRTRLRDWRTSCAARLSMAPFSRGHDPR